MTVKLSLDADTPNVKLCLDETDAVMATYRYVALPPRWVVSWECFPHAIQRHLRRCRRAKLDRPFWPKRLKRR